MDAMEKAFSTNTGWKNGVLRNIEVMCKRPLQWFVCLLHFNKLPYRHLFEHLDGTTTGPASFSDWETARELCKI